MVVILRFRDLKARNIVTSWPQLRRLQENAGFPLGRMLSPNTRGWTEKEVDDWIASRPPANLTPLRGGAKVRHARKEATAAPRDDAA
jgi:hypothetical protein